MLKKIFKWGKNSPPNERDSTVTVQPKDPPQDFQSNSSVKTPRRYHRSHTDSEAYSKPDAYQDNGFFSHSTGTRIFGPETHPSQLQEISSTVVCDFGEMDATSPVVQQVRQQIAGDAFGAFNGDGPKFRSSRRQRDSWPPRLKGTLPSDGAVSPPGPHSPQASPPSNDQNVWHWSPAALSPMSPNSVGPMSSDVIDLQCENDEDSDPFKASERAPWATPLSVQTTHKSFDPEAASQNVAGSQSMQSTMSAIPPPSPVQYVEGLESHEEGCPPYTLVPGGDSGGRSSGGSYGKIFGEHHGEVMHDAREWEQAHYPQLYAQTSNASTVDYRLTGNDSVASARVEMTSMQEGTVNSVDKPAAHAVSHDVVAAATASTNGLGHAGTLMEGALAKLAKKRKDWEDLYCILSCKPREDVHFGGVDFAYMLDFYASRDDAASGQSPLESIHAGHASVQFVQGTVFTIKTSGEKNKKGATHFVSANSVDETKGWFNAMQLVPDVHVDWVGKDGEVLS